jgi:23S rRNA G2445 N2-methylase RlmL
MAAKTFSFVYRAFTNPGLEAVLKKEVDTLYPGLSYRMNPRPGLVEIRDERNPFSDMNSNAIDEFLSTVILKSRVLERIHISMGPNFTAQWEKQVRENLVRLPWNMFYRKGSELPEVSVKSYRSRLHSEKLITSLIHESFHSSRGSPSDSVSPSPPILVRVEEDKFEISIDCGGSLNLYNFQKLNLDSRIPIPQSVANGIIHRSIIPILKSIKKNKIVIWDPFCSDGLLPLMTAHALSGVPSGSPARNYSFRRFPFHNFKIFNNISNSLNSSKFAKSVRIVGTDSFKDSIAISNQNLSTMHSLIPAQSDGTSLLSVPVNFRRNIEAYKPPEICHDEELVVTTAVPVSKDSNKRIANLVELENISKFILISKNEINLKNCVKELRFGDNKRREFGVYRIDRNNII